MLAYFSPEREGNQKLSIAEESGCDFLPVVALDRTSRCFPVYPAGSSFRGINM